MCIEPKYSLNPVIRTADVVGTKRHNATENGVNYTRSFDVIFKRRKAIATSNEYFIDVVFILHHIKVDANATVWSLCAVQNLTFITLSVALSIS